MTLRALALLAVATLALAGCFGSAPVADRSYRPHIPAPTSSKDGTPQPESETCVNRAVYAEKKLADWRQYAEALEGVCGIHTKDRPDD